MSTQQGTETDVGAQAQILVPGAERGGDDAAEVMRAVADGLAQHGLHVRGPESGSHYLKISNVPGISCDVAIIEDGPAEWEYRLGHGDEADPARMVCAVLSILGATPMQLQSLSSRYPNRTSESVIGRLLADHGMQVALGAVHKDEFFFEVHPEIEVANPAQPQRGMVRIAASDSFMWECQLSSAPEGVGIAPQDFAATIASVLAASLVASSQPVGPVATPGDRVSRVQAEGDSGR